MEIYPRIFHKKNIIMSGGLRFIGSNLAIILLGYGANVTIVDRLILDSMQNPIEDLDIITKVQLSILEACRKYNSGIKIIMEPSY